MTKIRLLPEGLESAIQNVICAMGIAEDPIDAAMSNSCSPQGREAACYALINLVAEVETLRLAIEHFYEAARRGD